MKLFIRISLLFLCPFFATAQTQQKQLDSLNTAFTGAANDTIKMSILNGLAYYYSESNWDSALLFTEQALDISKQINQPLWTANLLLGKAYFLEKKGNLPLAFRLTNEAMSIAQDEKNGKNPYIDKADKFADDPHKYRLDILAGVFHILGNLYSVAGNKEKAIEYYKEEIQVSEEIIHYENLVNSNMNIGSIFLNLDKLDSAWLYSFRALSYANSTGYKAYQGNILMNIGTIYLKRKQIDSAKHYYWQALTASKEQNNVATETGVDISLAKLYESVQHPDSMLYYAKAALNIATNLKAAFSIAGSTKVISDAYKMLGNTDSAFAYLSISKAVGDSLNSDRNEKLTQFQNINFEQQMQLEKTAQENIAYKNKIRTIALFSGLGLLSLLAFVFYRNNRQKQKANKILQQQKEKIETTLNELKSTQSQLIQSEKMASLGELTAGIAHEIQNPLNFVNNFSEVNTELIDELQAERSKKNGERKEETENEILVDIKQNTEKINYHGKRADAIVKGMLQHSRTSSGQKELTDINALCDEYLRLSYHGLRAKDNSFNATMKTEFDETISNVKIIPQDIGRVLLNLYTNAFYATNEKSKQSIQGYEPIVSVSTKKIVDKVEIKVKDNGNGIPQNIVDKIFQPFFTTKPTGQGTGLGLSLSYDIVKAHGGEIKVESKEGEGTEFIIQLSV